MEATTSLLSTALRPCYVRYLGGSSISNKKEDSRALTNSNQLQANSVCDVCLTCMNTSDIVNDNGLFDVCRMSPPPTVMYLKLQLSVRRSREEEICDNTDPDQWVIYFH